MPSIVANSPYTVPYILPSGGSGGTGTVDFSLNMKGTAGAQKLRTPQGFSGAVLFFKNDTDSGLLITMQPSSAQIFLAPGDAETVPVITDDVKATWLVAYQNNFQAHSSQMLSVIFYSPADIQAGYAPAGGSGTVNPPSTVQAQSVIGDFQSSHDAAGSNFQPYTAHGTLPARGMTIAVWDGTGYDLLFALGSVYAGTSLGFYLDNTGVIYAENDLNIVGPQKIRFNAGFSTPGTHSLTDMNVLSGTGTTAGVAHGLSGIPTIVLLCPTSAVSTFFVGNYTATTFDVSMSVAGTQWKALALR